MSNISKSPVARSIPFDTSENLWPLTPKNTQEAIEYARNNAVATVRFCIVTTFNGTMGSNQWLGYNELMPGNAVPIVLPMNCILKEISTSYNGAAVDGRLDLYKNGITSGELIDNTTFTYTNQASRKTFTGLNYSFAAGDQLRMRWIDLGDNPSDFALVYFFEVVG